MSIVNNLAVVDPQTLIMSLLEKRKKIGSVVDHFLEAEKQLNSIGIEIHRLERKLIAYNGINSKSLNDAITKEFDQNSWETVLDKSGLKNYMNSRKISEFRKSVADKTPAFELSYIKGTFGVLFENKEKLFLEGLIDVFKSLSSHYRSHDAFKIKKRMIIQNFLDAYSYSSHRKVDMLNDADRIVHIMNDEDVPTDYDEKLGGIVEGLFKKGEAKGESKYFRFNLFHGNGNVHLYFKAENDLYRMNKAISYYYGQTLQQA